MRQCPACGNWTLDYDEYFGRFRCFDPDCGWTPFSSAEQEIRRLQTGGQLEELCVEKIEDLGLTFRASYDSLNDALVFDFGLHEPTFDFPEGDGRMIWRIGHHTGSVAGFSILGARKFGVAEVRVDVPDGERRQVDREKDRVALDARRGSVVPEPRSPSQRHSQDRRYAVEEPLQVCS